MINEKDQSAALPMFDYFFLLAGLQCGRQHCTVENWFSWFNNAYSGQRYNLDLICDVIGQKLLTKIMNVWCSYFDFYLACH